MAPAVPTDSPQAEPIPVIAPTPSPNPWADTQPVEPKPPLVDVSTQELEIPSHVFDEAISPSTPSKIAVDSKLLNEFDPLVDKDAQKAWASSEGRPPPPQAPAPPPKPPAQPLRTLETRLATAARQPRRPSTVMDPPTSAAAHVTTFATLASLARAPFGRRSRSSSTTQPLPPSENAAGVIQTPSTPLRNSIPIPTDPAPPPTPAKDDRLQGDPSKADPPFDFQKFLDQMKTKAAEPVAKYLRSFLNNFAKRNFTVNDQIKLIRDFLDFITEKMRECDVWKNASEAEFDNATEAMEKLVMNRLYDYTFTPQMDQATHPVTTDDLERDHVLRQRMKLFGWVREEHLDVPTGEGSQGFMNFAEQELLKMNHYKAPRDKVICILNCCKVIFGLIRHLQKDEGADAFIPILIFVVLKANPEHLISNIEYINRFRSPSKLQSESGYYLSSLTGAVSFIETMDHTSLSNITQEEFESNVEAAIQALPPSPSPTDRNEDPNRFPTPPAVSIGQAQSTPTPASSHTGEEPAIPLKLPSTTTIAEDTKRFLQRTGDSISKPLNAIGKIFNEAMDGLDELERQRELAKQQERREGEPTLAGPPGGESSSIFQQISPEWLFGNGTGSPRSGTPHTPAAATSAPVTPGVHQAPYRPRIRPGSAGAGSGRRTPEPTLSQQSPHNHRHSSYQIPAPSFQPSPQMTPSRSLPADQFLRPDTPQTDPRSLLAGDYPGSGANTRAVSPLDLTALQNEIDRAHSQANMAAKGTLLQMFPTCDPEVIDMVLEASRGDLGQSIENLLDMMAT